jgi:2-hydroxychromene-2-carboxylate isomerase
MIKGVAATTQSADAGAAARAIDFYFDFISPFGFFASLRIDALAAKYGLGANWHSMLIGVSVVKVMGMKPLLEMPLKGPYIARDARRYARRHGIALARDPGAPPVDPRPAGRAFNWLLQHHPDAARRYAQRAFAAYWLQGRDISVPATVAEIVGETGLAGNAIAAGIASEEAGRLLRGNVEASLARGVFGSPFFVVGDEPFFGVEKMELLEDWLASGGW